MAIVFWIPIHGQSRHGLFVEVAGPDHRDGDFDPIIQGSVHPGIKTAAGGAGHAYPLRIHLGAAEEILQFGLRVVDGVTLLRNTHQKSFGATMVSPGKAALSLTERFKV
jgi:hypothetical protein